MTCEICDRTNCERGEIMGDDETCFRLGYEKTKESLDRISADFANACAVGRKLEAENAGLRESLRDYYDALRENDKLRDLLRRISEWDQMDMTADGPFWRSEIANAIEPRP